MDDASWTQGWESCRLIPYWDGTGEIAYTGDLPTDLHNGVANGTLTAGYGHTGPDVEIGVAWTQPQADSIYAADIQIARTGACDLLGSATPMSEARHGAFTDLCFELGKIGLRRFVLTISAARAGNWGDCADQLLQSAYAKETPRRATANSDVLRSGAWIIPHPNNPAIV